MDYRSGIDVMTTETTCLSSVWQTDGLTKTALTLLGRGDSYQELSPADGAYYDSLVTVELDKVEPMIALPPLQRLPHPGVQGQHGRPAPPGGRGRGGAAWGEKRPLPAAQGP
jgi:aconitase A